MAPRPQLTIRRVDSPRWLPFSNGWVYLDDRRVTLLVGGKPRTIAIAPGERGLRVRFDPFAATGAQEATVTITVEEGKSYRFRCGVRVDQRVRTYVSFFLLTLVTLGACVAGLFTLPLLRAPALALLGNIYRGTSLVNDRGFVFLDRLLRDVTSELSGMLVGTFVFHLAARKAYAALSRHFHYDLEEE